MPATNRNLKIGPSNSIGRQIIAGASCLKKQIMHFQGNLSRALKDYITGLKATEKYENDEPLFTKT